jgi:hypothetical protein
VTLHPTLAYSGLLQIIRPIASARARGVQIVQIDFTPVEKARLGQRTTKNAEKPMRPTTHENCLHSITLPITLIKPVDTL